MPAVLCVVGSSISLCMLGNVLPRHVLGVQAGLCNRPVRSSRALAVCPQRLSLFGTLLGMSIRAVQAGAWRRSCL